MTARTRPEAVVPGVGRRLASMLYECLLLIGVLAAVAVLPYLVFASATDSMLPRPVIRVYVFLVLAFYFIWHWHRGGQTLAMRTWKLRIVARSGNAPSLTQLALRYVLAWPSLTVFGVGILWAFADHDRQFLHDRLAGTRIVFGA